VSIGDVVKSRIDELETERAALTDYITGARLPVAQPAGACSETGTVATIKSDRIRPPPRRRALPNANPGTSAAGALLALGDVELDLLLRQPPLVIALKCANTSWPPSTAMKPGSAHGGR